MSKEKERLVHAGRSFSEGIIEAWANLYTEFAMAITLRNNGVNPPIGWGNFTSVSEGVQGVNFIEASVQSNQSSGSRKKFEDIPETSKFYHGTISL